MMKRSKLAMQVAYDSDSSNPSDIEDDLPSMADITGEFDPAAQHRRKRRKRTKQDAREAAALGVFGSDSDDDDNKDYSRGTKGRRGFRSLREGGMSFVKTGEGAEGDDEGDDSDEDEDEEDDKGKEDTSVEATAGLRDIGTGRGTEGYSEDDDDDRRTGLGASIRAGLGGGLGFKLAADEMDVDDEDDRPRIGLGGGGPRTGLGSSLRSTLFAPRSLGGRAAPTSGTATPGSLDGHRGLGFHSAGTSSIEHSPAPETDRHLFTKPGKGGLGFRKAGTIDSADLDNQPMPADHVDELQDEGVGGGAASISAPLGKGFVSSIRQNAMLFAPPTFDDEEPAAAPEKPKIRPSFTDIRGTKKGKGDAPAINQESFAARMMAKMGYVAGQGLGKTGEGRLAAVDVQLRPTRIGLGAVSEMTKQAKKEEKRAKLLRGEVPSDSDSEKERKKRKKKKAKALGEDVSGSGASTPARRKPKFKTAEEMAKELDGLTVPSALKNIIDYTGKEARTLDAGSPGLMLSGGVQEVESENAKIAKLARRELEDFSKEWKRLQERKKFIQAEENRMTEDMDEQAEMIKALQAIVELTESLSIDASGAENRNEYEDKIGTLASELESLQFKFQNEVELYDLPEVAIAAFHPLVSPSLSSRIYITSRILITVVSQFKSALAHWDPLTDPVYLLDHVRKLRNIFNIRTLEDIESSLVATGYAERSGKKSTFYESMMYHIWLPRVRTTINNHWDVHDPTPVLTILETWAAVLPPFIHANILNQLVLPKVKAAVTEWNPRTSSKKRPTPPPHVWVFPWLPHLSAHMDDLVREVKRKFRVILDKWDLYKGVVDGLEAWREVFGPGELEKLLISHLLPRLADLLRRKFEVNPADQDIRPLEAVMAWHGFFRQSTFAQLLEAEFFPKWMQTLYSWLTMDGVDLEEVSEWYSWWGEQFPKEVKEYVQVRREFKNALDMMAQAMDVQEGVGGAKLLPPESGAARPLRPSPPPAQASSSTKGGTSAKGKANGGAAPLTETTFREYMEEWCAEQGLILMPLRKAHEATGQPLFRITESASGSGGVLCYFKDDVVWAQDRKKREVFEPTSLEKIQAQIEAAHH
ncbi:hypothetical protein Dda_5430 [Drechslerella dactyloides]|uniref:G-patch domain-containing protein n=1 Tax=Drechslerella dactyloides TaxID=74499 RepID=A0AAD6IXI1_DREDA|nr:hypothetical protein Dda_5430 [Drechslerella dactyloides]